MKTIFLYIPDPKLRLLIIRILLENDLPFVEALDRPEVSIKLDLIKDIGLIIEEYQEGKEGIVAIHTFADERKVPIIWIVPEYKKELIPQAVKFHIADLIPLPLDESTFIRKVNGYMGLEDKQQGEGERAASLPLVLPYRSEELKEAVELAEKGRYPLCIVRLQVENLSGDESREVLNRLTNLLRRSDRILEMDFGGYIVLCPFAPKSSLPVIESKLRDGVKKYLQERKQDKRIHLFGIGFPDDAKQWEEMIQRAEQGIEKSIKISKAADAMKPWQQKRVLHYRGIFKIKK